MSLKSYLAILIVTASLCWGGLWYVINSVNPDLTNWIGFLLFYVSLFLAISVTASLLGFIVRFLALRKELVTCSVRAAFRQSFLFASLIVVALLLLASDLFNWLSVVLLIIGLSILEYFMLCYEHTEHGAQNMEHEEGEFNINEEEIDDNFKEENAVEEVYNPNTTN